MPTGGEMINGDCGQLHFTGGQGGVVTSPGFYNDHYYHSADYNCDYRISVVRGATIHLIFTVFALNAPMNVGRSNLVCWDDWIAVYDGPSTHRRHLLDVYAYDENAWRSRPSHRRLCGSDLPSEIRSTSNTVIMKFVTDSSAPHRSDFRFEWRTVYFPIDFPGCGIRPLSDNELNRRSEHMTKRIIRGEPVPAYSMPYVCRVVHGGFSCTGTLVRNLHGQFFMITAAHCFAKNGTLDPPVVLPNSRVYCGSHLRHENTIEFAVSNITWHETYVPNTDDYPHDIAVVALASQQGQDQATYNRIMVHAACITNEQHFTGENGTAVGWGQVNGRDGYIRTNTLQQLSMTIRSNVSMCAWSAAFESGVELCVTKILWTLWNGNDLMRFESKGGICDGDSGGPLFSLRNGKWYLVGVASRAKGCGDAQYGDIFEDVFHFRGWIDDQINGEYSHRNRG